MDSLANDSHHYNHVTTCITAHGTSQTMNGTMLLLLIVFLSKGEEGISRVIARKRG